MRVELFQSAAEIEFRQWREKNSGVVDAVFALADGMRQRGYRNWSMRAAMHVVRWQTAMRESPDEGFKINNNRSAALARLYNERAGFEFFRLRERDT